MSLYLLKGSDNAVSMTSLSVFGVGFFIFLISFYLRNKPAIALPVLTALCYVWSIARNWKKKRPWAIFDYLYLAMSLYLLKGSDNAVSMTSLSVFGVGFFIFLI